MKYLRITAIVIICLAFGTYVQAQVIVNGTNLNIGFYNTLNQNHGNAIGEGHWVGGNHSLAVGNNDTILTTGNSAIALGALNRIENPMSMAIGSSIRISGIRGIGIGHHLKLQGPSGCMAIGSGIIGTSINPDKFLENNYETCLLVGFNSTKPTLTVGPSPNDYPQGNSYDKTGKVAIGNVPVSELTAKLHVRSDAGEDASLFLQPASPSSDNACLLMRDSTHFIQVDNTGSMMVRSKNGINFAPLLLEGRVGINVSDPSHMPSGYALLVHGSVMAEKVTIKSYSQWYDYVFDTEYRLMPLPELKDYVTKHHHLPDIPPADDVIANGVEIGEIQGVLLKKIEELTLYTIQLQEQWEQVQKQLDELK